MWKDGAVHPYDGILIVSIATAVGWTAAIYVKNSPLLVIGYIVSSAVGALVAGVTTDYLHEAQSKFPLIFSAFLGAVVAVAMVRFVARRKGLR